MCGEQPGGPVDGPAALGSPPRVRGTASMRRKKHVHSGITPACAGNRVTIIMGTKKINHHPRVCGEQGILMFVEIRQKGSPPRVRGTVGDCSAYFLRVGITPACAGNSNKSFLSVSPPLGSPPRVRGTGFCVVDKRKAARITPACAGNRHISVRIQIALEDHPRVCGEQ